MKKLFVLKVDVGHGTNIRDVQLWDESGKSAKSVGEIRGKVVGTIDLSKLPLWICKSSIYTCYTTSSTTQAYFKAKLLKKRHHNRGIIVEIHPTKTSTEHLVFRKELFSPTKFRIQCFTLDISLKRQLDTLISQRQQTAHSVRKDHSIDAILAKNQKMRADNTNRIAKNVQASDFKQQFVSTLSRCILSGLRLRCIEQKHDFLPLYKATFSAAEFAFREELKAAKEPITFEQVQEVVETLLKLFTKS